MESKSTLHIELENEIVLLVASCKEKLALSQELLATRKTEPAQEQYPAKPTAPLQ